MENEQPLIEKRSLFGFNETVEILVEAATSRDWGNPATHDLKQSLAKSGKIVMPVKVIEICKPAYSGVMLEKSDERIVSVMMPCRISVYEKADGLVYIALLNGRAFAAGMPANLQPVMIAAANEVDEIVQTVLNPIS